MMATTHGSALIVRKKLNHLNMQEYIDQIISVIKAQISSNQFLTGGLILGSLTTMVYSLRAIPKAIWQRIERRIKFEVTIEQNDDLYPWIQHWLNVHYSNQLRSVKATFWRIYETSESNGNAVVNSHNGKRQHQKVNEVVFNHYGDTFVIFYANRFIKISSSREKMEHASNWESLFFEKFYISGIASKMAIHKLLKDIADYNIKMEERNVSPKIKCNIYDHWETERSTRLRDIDSIFINEHKKNEIISDMDSFVKSKHFYISRNIPYRRGYLFEGPPGTGKSSLASALSNHFKKDLHSLNLKSLSDDNQFRRLMGNVSNGSILLIEDIDGYFDGRKSETKINFSSFLNEISGIKCREDVILIVTTNHKSKIDDALMRSGRLDVHVEIGLPSALEVNSYLSWFYSKKIEAISGPINYNMADVENICVQNKFDAQRAIELLQERPRLAVNS